MQVEALTERLIHGWHLVRRFFGFIRAQPPGPGDQDFVARYLDGPCARIFWEQQHADQRHAIDVARRVAAALPGDDAAVRAALLHDVGKRNSHTGAVSRSIATVFDSMGIPVTSRMSSYRSHGPIGADELASIGCDPLAVAFARHHPGAAPDGVDPTRWAILLDADG